MKVLGLVTEYNPFHFGHKHHLEYSKKALNSTHTLIVMSSSFVQRGEPAFLDKWTRAKMAIDNGVDLVLELPFVYAVQSAELFALGALRILDSLNIVDYISFGSEQGNIEELEMISEILLEEGPVFKETLTKNLKKGLSFSVSRSKAIQEAYKASFKEDGKVIERILKQSNNILGIEYLKAIKKLSSQIKPFTMQRLGDQYKDRTVEGIASATGIRNTFFQDGINSIKGLVPQVSYEYLSAYYKEYGAFNSLDKYYDIINYLLITKSLDELKNIFDMENGLENRMVRVNQETSNIYDFIKRVSTKRYPKTRIQRILLHLLIGLDKNEIRKIYKNPNNYIRILASNKKGLEVIRLIKNSSNLHIINKFSDYKKLNNPDINTILKYEEKSTDLFFLGMDSNEYNMDYFNSPYIK